MDSVDVHLNVAFRRTAYEVVLPSSSTLGTLHDRLEELTAVPPGHQKLLYKGKKSAPNDAGIADAGLRDGMKVQLLGVTQQEVGGLRAAEDETKRRDEIMRRRADKGPTKVRATGPSPSAAANATFKFYALRALPHLPAPESAHALLARLASDPAILHVMRTHSYKVGLLTELAPHEQPTLLGLNVNAGEAIKLRLRTNAYDGFRLYADIRRVLCHELAHNVWGDHDDNFKALNSQHNREVAEFERAARAGAHTLSGNGEFYEPSPSIAAEVHSHILGGSSSASASSSAGGSREERRQRVLEATMMRLNREEEELEQSCGTVGPQATDNGST